MADLAAQLALAKRIIDRLPLCTDHRDKVRGRCLECVNVALLEALEAILSDEELYVSTAAKAERYRMAEQKARAAIAQAKGGK